MPAYVCGDALRLRQVIINLVSNAIKFTDHGAITTKVYPGDDGKTFYIDVIDTGVGIDDAAHTKIFDAFSQGGNGSDKRGGTGLGLAISKHLVDTMGGRITFNSRLGQGSTFSIRLPLLSVKLDESKVQHLAYTQPVYIFTDNEQLYGHTVSGMKRAGFSDIRYGSSIERETSSFDRNMLVMVDVDYPGQDIFETLRTSKAPPKMVLLQWVNQSGQHDDINWDMVVSRPLTRKKIANIYYLITDQIDPVTRELTLELPVPGKFKLLIVDDNKVNLMIAEAKLEKAGYGVLCCDNADEALDMLEKEKFDLVLMDVNMPAMSGIDATRKIRQHTDEKIRQMPVIALTANIMQEDIQHYLDAGMNDYIGKPIDTRQLYSTVFKWCKNPG
jgi:CheY-like chemotaxis protein